MFYAFPSEFILPIRCLRIDPVESRNQARAPLITLFVELWIDEIKSQQHYCTELKDWLKKRKEINKSFEVWQEQNLKDPDRYEWAERKPKKEDTIQIIEQYEERNGNL